VTCAAANAIHSAAASAIPKKPGAYRQNAKNSAAIRK